MKIYNYNGFANISGPKIREVRERRGWTQEELAAKLQLENVVLSQKSISRIEQRERVVSDYELLVLARVLNTDLYQLIGLEKV